MHKLPNFAVSHNSSQTSTPQVAAVSALSGAHACVKFHLNAYFIHRHTFNSISYISPTEHRSHLSFVSCLSFDLLTFLEEKNNRPTLPAASLLGNKDLTESECVLVCVCARVHFSSLVTVSTEPVILNQLMSPRLLYCMFSNSEKPKIERQTSSNDATVHVKLERVKLAYILFLLQQQELPCMGGLSCREPHLTLQRHNEGCDTCAPASCIPCVAAWRV